ncbi:NAD(P)H-dependent oxidoreductase [Mesorhizobium sp. CAU 1732]|uniref:NADPH-dependent FMN reductase n=1 Tax=Mesorhizobium sp. CAU 1732 TaxID=3140358 RepID=UPI003260C42B
MQKALRIAVIYGSVRDGRLCDTIVSWVAGQIGMDSRFEIDLVDPADHTPERASGRTSGNRLAAADGFIVVTPEYNHSFTGALKSFIDTFGEEWHAKPVAFVSYGGLSGGLRAVEHLRGVFAELHAVGLRDTVSFAGVWNRFGADGELKDPVAAERSMATLLSRLHWWASALRSARADREFEVAA